MGRGMDRQAEEEGEVVLQSTLAACRCRVATAVGSSGGISNGFTVSGAFARADRMFPRDEHEHRRHQHLRHDSHVHRPEFAPLDGALEQAGNHLAAALDLFVERGFASTQIGRASCRERV